MLVLFPGCLVKGPRLVLNATTIRPNFLISLLGLFQLNMVARLELGVAAINDAHVFNDAPVNNFAVRRLDEAELVDARETRERRDEPDVRPFRRLDRADATVVRRVDVAHFETGALAREAARPEGREPALVRDLGERV